jgi:hypothetical protein
MEKTENKNEVIKAAQQLLFAQQKKDKTEKVNKKFEAKYAVANTEITIGTKVKIKTNHQIGIVQEIKQKLVVVKVGLMPISVKMENLVAVIEKEIEVETKK